MGWLFGWLGFGLLAAYQAGEIAKHAASEAAMLLAPVALVASLGCLLALVRQAAQQARPRQLLGVLIFCLAGLAGCFLLLYGGEGSRGGWTTAALAAGAYLLLSLAVAAAGLLIAWRRLRAREEEATAALIERERHTRMARILRETTAAEPLGEPGLDDDEYRLPSRPKWDESV